MDTMAINRPGPKPLVTKVTDPTFTVPRSRRPDPCFKRCRFLFPGRHRKNRPRMPGGLREIESLGSDPA